MARTAADDADLPPAVQHWYGTGHWENMGIVAYLQLASVYCSPGKNICDGHESSKGDNQ